jgi:hypothetical protein
MIFPLSFEQIPIAHDIGLAAAEVVKIRSILSGIPTLFILTPARGRAIFIFAAGEVMPADHTEELP